MDTKTAIERNEGRTRHRLREAAGASWLPWLTGRAIVLAALALARYEVSHLHIQDQKAAAHTHSGLLGWDAGWYPDIAAHGYHAVGLQGLRFFPLLPVTASLVHHITFLPVNAATLVIANGCGLAATMAIYLLARSEFGDAGRARTVAWLFNLVPAAFVTVMGYSDSLLILLAVTCFYCLRHQRWWFAAGLGLLAGTARPDRLTRPPDHRHRWPPRLRYGGSRRIHPRPSLQTQAARYAPVTTGADHARARIGRCRGVPGRRR